MHRVAVRLLQPCLRPSLPRHSICAPARSVQQYLASRRLFSQSTSEPATSSSDDWASSEEADENATSDGEGEGRSSDLDPYHVKRYNKAMQNSKPNDRRFVLNGEELLLLLMIEARERAAAVPPPKEVDPSTAPETDSVEVRMGVYRKILPFPFITNPHRPERDQPASPGAVAICERFAEQFGTPLPFDRSTATKTEVSEYLYQAVVEQYERDLEPFPILPEELANTSATQSQRRLARRYGVDPGSSPPPKKRKGSAPKARPLSRGQLDWKIAEARLRLWREMKDMRVGAEEDGERKRSLIILRNID